MADLADIAEENNNFNEVALEKAKVKYTEASHCRDCGVELHPVRVQFGRCLICAQHREQS